MVAAALFVCAAPGEARARPSGTFFLVEVSTGITESAYAGGPGMSYGVTAGVTLKHRRYPFRFHFLSTLVGRNAVGRGEHRGFAYAADRRDVDLYASHRLVVPIGWRLRLYGEAGVGQRWIDASLRRASLGTLSVRDSELLVVLAGGLQARLSERFSIGLRGEVTPLDPAADLIAAATGGVSTQNRVSLSAHLGIHF